MREFSERQMQIMEAALQIISGSGARQLTMKTIGRKLGFTDAALYRHFQNKEEILLGIIDLFEASSNRILAEILEGKSAGLEKIKAFFLDRSREFSRNRGLALVMFSEDLFADEREVLSRFFRIMKGHKEMLLGAVQEGQKSGKIRTDLPAEHVFIMVMGSLRLLINKWRGSGFSFDLGPEGEALWESLERVFKEKKNEKRDH